MKNVKIEILKGKTIVNINVERGYFEDTIEFEDSDGVKYLMYHDLDCCEEVFIEDICGDLDNLLNTPLTLVEEVKRPGDEPRGEHAVSCTWTFYKFATIKGYVTIRWFGESNGCYSEEVDFAIID